MAVDVDAGATLGAMREGIARQTGIVVKQQRLIILGASDVWPDIRHRIGINHAAAQWL